MVIYDEVFRSRAVSYYYAIHNYEKASKVFGISAGSLHRWVTKGIKPQGRKGNKNALKINEEALSQYVIAHPDAQLKELAELFNSSTSGISSALHRLGFTYKKNKNDIRKRTNISVPSSKRK